MGNSRFFRQLQQSSTCFSADFLERSDAYILHGVVYNGFADMEKPVNES
jgi:hypothetical protein